MNDDHEPSTSDDRPVPGLAELAREIDPARDLWPEIARRTVGAERPPAAAPRARPLRVLALAASLVVALAAGWLVRGRMEPVVLEVPAPRPAPIVPGVATTAYAATGRELDAIRDELRRAIEAQRDALPPETRRLVFDNLATIERAIAEIERALAASPADAELAETYVTYRQRQIDLLRQANRIAARL